MVWREGEQIGPYIIEEMIGQGGMATVYKAHHAQLDRHVALKVMLQNYQDDESFVTRFQREARIVASLEHPHIVPVYDFSQHDGQPYLVMKLIQGQTLKRRLLKRTLSLDEILDIMTAVGSALSYAHERGVLHRDIKPSNIVIDMDDVPYVTDFGLARMVHLGESTLSADMLLGTPHYISPEQARGEKDLDGRSDLYALGVILYELLVGHVPFTGDTPYAIIHDHIYTALPLPSSLNSEIPEAVEAVLIRTLAKSRYERYDTANEMVTALKAAIKQTNLQELSESRVETASVAWERHSSLSQPNPLSGSDALQSQPQSQPAHNTKTPPQKSRNHRRIWQSIGCGGFLAMLLIAGVVLLNTADNLMELRALNLLEETPSSMIQPRIDETASATRGYPITSVDTLSISEAQSLVATQPEATLAYLTLANAYWSADDNLAAQQTISQGLSTAEDTSVYFMNAAQLADSHEAFEAAVIYNALALIQPSPNSTYADAVQNAATEYLYHQVGSNDGIQLTDLSGDLARLTDGQLNLRGIADSPLANYIAAIQLVRDNNFVLANASINRLVDTNYQSQAKVLQADLHLKRGQNARALLVLRDILDDDRAPDWVHQFAETKLEELENPS